MSGQLPDGIGAERVTVTLTRSEWGVIVAALWEAPLPAKLTNPALTKLQQQLAPQQPTPTREATS